MLNGGTIETLARDKGVRFACVLSGVTLCASRKSGPEVVI